MGMIRQGRLIKGLAFGLLVLGLAAGIAAAQTDVPFQKPSKEILELADVAQPPRMITDRHHRYMAFRPTSGWNTSASRPRAPISHSSRSLKRGSNSGSSS